jgi:hypothetical protein
MELRGPCEQAQVLRGSVAAEQVSQMCEEIAAL